MVLSLSDVSFLRTFFYAGNEGFYSCIAKSILTSSITVWYSNTTAINQKQNMSAERGKNC